MHFSPYISCLANNELNGTIPGEIQTLTSMEYLDLSMNYLKGTLPLGLERLSTSLKVYRCARNEITGTLPEVFGNMAALQELYVSMTLGSIICSHVDLV